MSSMPAIDSSAAASSRAAPEDGPALELEGVIKSFPTSQGGRSTALAGVSLKVMPHRFVAIVGPSGCGKTTLLRVANGLIIPDEGTVRVGGKPPVPGAGMGFVFQGFRLIPWRTVEANIAFALEATSLPANERTERVRHYMDIVGLTRWARHYPGQLSGGMRQRVALARALAGEPDILLMDEPFASLDAQTRELMQAELLALWERRRPTVLFVTHSVDEALLLADRVLIMGSGSVLEDLPIDIERPRSPSLARADKRFVEMREHLWTRIRTLVLSDPQSAFYGRDTVI